MVSESSPGPEGLAGWLDLVYVEILLNMVQRDRFL